MNKQTETFQYNGTINWFGRVARAVIVMVLMVAALSGSLAGPTAIFWASVVSIYLSMVAITSIEPAYALVENGVASIKGAIDRREKRFAEHSKNMARTAFNH